ncbi:Ethanolamine ammonia-lyase light chain [Paenibacillus konkukensis]|uniref:Ethanolamine ammonia-lyase small subunit n=1 Tax=Paenibacillus konkukensis TaxID=2020716 RepID=A0ABY4RJK9_9BACL|nr:ethanolamine ammonia-lyase subunit EutC [Paenibacillus konkukensis]UQZ82205.1 Ethanolamine ammonia-lyase light chain [Paenibacillus konkukensis]
MNRTKPLELDQLVDKVMAELEKKLLSQEQPLPLVTEAGGNRDPSLRSPERSPRAPAHAEPDYGGGTTADEADSDRDLSDSPAENDANEAPPVSKIPSPKWADGMGELVSSTPARIGVWRTGTRVLTKELLKFRCDHAAAVDSIYGKVNPSLLGEFGLFQVETHFRDTDNYLKRPDMGRVITDEGAQLILKRCIMRPQVQIVVSDGLSANAVDANLADVYPSLLDSLASYGLTQGTPFFVRGGRVAVMDHIGDLLQPEALVLLIGERPGLVSSRSMSAYMCYRPHRGTVESDRTVISNIHPGGTPPVEAGAHIGTILRKMLEQQASGVNMEL